MKNTVKISLLIFVVFCVIILVTIQLYPKVSSTMIVSRLSTTSSKNANITENSSDITPSPSETVYFNNIIVRDIPSGIPPNNFTQSSTNEEITTITDDNLAIENSDFTESQNSSDKNNINEIPNNSQKYNDFVESKVIEYVSSNEIVTPTPTVPPVVTPLPTSVTVEEDTLPYYIKINKTQNVVNIYSKDSEGNYTVPYKVLLCSTGTYTPATGKIVQLSKDRYRWGLLNGNVYGQYATRITGSILFHSVPYTAQRNNALEYWEYDKLGTKASAGCIRLTTIDAKWIYENIAPGTTVEFYADDDPGPLGKPVAQKISSNTSLRGWDPTDPDEKNPWNEYQSQELVISDLALVTDGNTSSEFYIVTSPDNFGAQEFGDLTSIDFWDSTAYGELSDEWVSDVIN